MKLLFLDIHLPTDAEEDLSQGPKSTVIRVDYFVRDRSYAYGVHI
jgi:hypothetical protein